jgi:phage FluMu gp28-like protein
VAKIAFAYGLGEAQINELEEAKAKVRGAVDVEFKEQKTEADYVETAVMFARDFSRLSAEQVIELKELLKRFEKSGEYSNGSAPS